MAVVTTGLVGTLAIASGFALTDEKPGNVQHNFNKPQIYKWTDISSFWGAKEI